MKKVSIISILLFLLLVSTSSVWAVVDPLQVSNNKFGVHIISPGFEEITGAAQLVNSGGGDWGYVTVVIQSNDRNKGKWQTFFNNLRRYHLIPIVRIAGAPVNSYWDRPKEEDAKSWAEFLNSLNWPTQNRYVTIYNEPNHASEWGNSVDPVSYAKVLNLTIDALKEASPDFFVLNAGLDASAPHSPPEYYDEHRFITEMEKTIPGIFSKLDGWVSHSYPNPAFAGSPLDFGRGTIRTFLWERNLISSLTHGRDLPIFITETGWKHAEGITYDRAFSTSQVVGEYFKTAFRTAWSDAGVVAVTPFLLTYQQPPFDHFSFKKFVKALEEEKLTAQVLGATTAEYYPQYDSMVNITKQKGAPRQLHAGELLDGKLPATLVEGETYKFDLVIKNIGQSIWGDVEDVSLKEINSQKGLLLEVAAISQSEQVEPDKNYTFTIKIKALKQGDYKLILNLFYGAKQFDNQPFEFGIEVKQPILLKVQTKLLWKNDFAGTYLLNNNAVAVDNNGLSQLVEKRELLPDKEYAFTLKKAFYGPKTIKATVSSGENILDFGTLTPDFFAAISQPVQLFKLLPFIN